MKAFGENATDPLRGLGIEPKPCPFCGEEPTLVTGSRCARVQCFHCVAFGPLVPFAHPDRRETQKEAIRRWNRRPL